MINAFPGYELKRLEDGKLHNMFRGDDVGFGGWVYAEPGMASNVALLDVGNMHGASIIALNKFGDYTQRYIEIRNARMAIKHGLKTGDFSEASKMFNGTLAKYLTSPEDADALQNAFKLILNSTYGIAAATFDNPLRDSRDINNIIALRGALFMRTLQDEIKNRGFRVLHLKTDSVKVPDATPELIDFIIDFGRQYGYEFEHECTYERICLVNDSVYIARYDDRGIRNKGGKHAGEWTATGKQFQVPYVFKSLFSKEPIEFEDMCEVMSASTALYLKGENSKPEFIGKVGQFCPVKPGCGGKELLRISKDKDDEGNPKFSAAANTKGYLWLESEVVRRLGMEDAIDKSYYENQVAKAIKTIDKFGDFEMFVDLDTPISNVTEPTDEDFKNVTPCHSSEFKSCWECPHFSQADSPFWEPVCAKDFDVSDMVPF